MYIYLEGLLSQWSLFPNKEVSDVLLTSMECFIAPIDNWPVVLISCFYWIFKIVLKLFIFHNFI